MSEETNQGISVESYLLGFTHKSLKDIADCLSDNDISRAMIKTHQAIKYIKDNLHLKSIPKEEIKIEEAQAEF